MEAQPAGYVLLPSAVLCPVLIVSWTLLFPAMLSLLFVFVMTWGFVM